MLIKRAVLDKIAEGSVTLAFRRWRDARVRVGTRLRTAVGVLLVESVDRVEPGDITPADARRAGLGTRDELLGSLTGHDGDIYRIGLRFDGTDPRETLRASAALSAADLDTVVARLARLEAVTQTVAGFWRIPEPPHIASDAYWRRAEARFAAGGKPCRELRTPLTGSLLSLSA